MNVIKFSKCRKLSCYFTQRWFHHGRSPNNFKNPRKTPMKICGGESFQYSYTWLHASRPCNQYNLVLQHRWRCYEKWLVVKVWIDSFQNIFGKNILGKSAWCASFLIKLSIWYVPEEALKIWCIYTKTF